MKKEKTQAPRFSKEAAFYKESAIARLMTRALREPDMLSLAAGFTDNAVLPRAQVAGLAARALARPQGASFLQYGANPGRLELREILARRTGNLAGERKGAFRAQEAIIGNGSQQILHLAVRALCSAGDAVLVESPTYFVFLEMLERMGVRAIPIPCRPDGAWDEPALFALLKKYRARGEKNPLKCVYLVSYFSNPSSRTLGRAQKARLGDFLKREKMPLAIIEDAAYRELYFEEPPAVPSVFSLPQYAGLPKLYCGTFTKPFATGLKVGFAFCSHAAWRAHILTLKGMDDFGTSHFDQALLQAALEEGLYDAQLKAARALYRQKAQILDAALRRHGLEKAGWSWRPAEGGLYLWLTGPEGLSTDLDSAFYRKMIKERILYVPGSLCFARGEVHNALRLSFGAAPREQLEEAARRFAQTAVKASAGASLKRVSRRAHASKPIS